MHPNKKRKLKKSWELHITKSQEKSLEKLGKKKGKIYQTFWVIFSKAWTSFQPSTGVRSLEEDPHPTPKSSCPRLGSSKVFLLLLLLLFLLNSKSLFDAYLCLWCLFNFFFSLFSIYFMLLKGFLWFREDEVWGYFLRLEAYTYYFGVSKLKSSFLNHFHE